VEVPRFEPKNRKEFEVWCEAWPINFYPGESQRVRSKGHTEAEMGYVQSMIDHLSELGADAGLLATPTSMQVICNSLQSLSRIESEHGIQVHGNPLYTPTMLCIDQLASIARGDSPGQERLPAGHYLCTGLDLFLTIEPELFSSMALVHSRIRRVYFLTTDATNGVLASSAVYLHSLRALNHHYRVFQVVLEEIEAEASVS
jgi:tRNA(Arg) A34 adenosine deaminase TadA